LKFRCRAKRDIEIIKSLRSNLIFGLIFGLIGGLIGGLIFGLIGGLVFGLSDYVIFGLSGGLIFGLSGGLIGGLKADIQTRIEPNQGIKGSVKNAIILSTIALTTALPFKLLLEHLLVAGDVPGVIILIIVPLILACLIWFSFQEGGGKAVLQHLALRIVFWCNGYAPPRYDLLLNYCTERLLLQRIGGRYRFMHKLLQDHFAAMELEGRI
jgi:hypothetical protein